MAEKENSNDFLNGVRIEQFIKSNNDQLKSALGGLGKDTTKSFSAILSNQKIQIKSLTSIDKTTKVLSSNVLKMLKTQDNILKVLSKDNKDKLSGKSIQDNILKALSKDNKKDKKDKKAGTNIFDAVKSKKSAPEPKKDLFKRVGFDKDNNSLLKKINKGINIMSKAKSALPGLVGGGLAALFAGGGILGFLLTGKTEMLGNISKGLQFGLQIGGKALPKALQSSKFMKGIPGVGLITSLITGVMRFKRGDITGGLIDLAGGLAGIIPGFGTAASIALTMYNMKRDLTMTKGEQAKEGKDLTNFYRNKENLKMVPGIGAIVWFNEGRELWAKGDKLGAIKAFARSGLNIAGFDLVAAIVEGNNSNKQNRELKQKADKDNASFESYKNTLNKMSSNQKESWLNHAKSQGWDMKARMANIDTYMSSNPGSADGKEADSSTLGNISNNFVKIMARNVSSSSGVSDVNAGSDVIDSVPKGIGVTPPAPSNYITPIMEDESVLKDRPESWKSYSIYKPWNPNISGVRDDVWNNFIGMAYEYNKLTDGGKIQINSAYRDPSKQQKLYDQYLKDKAAGKNPSPVAPPGRSMHNYGYAMDINGSDGDKLASMGLLSKWKFHRPVGKPGEKGWEPWHIEPIGLDKNAIRNGDSQGDPSAKPSGIGDSATLNPVSISSSGMPSVNLPQGTVSPKATPQQIMNVKLTSADIEALALAFGKQLSNIPTPKTTTVKSNSGSPRGNL